MQVIIVIAIIGTAVYFLGRKIARQFSKEGEADGGCNKCNH
jgi:hypothetical protein